MLQFPPAAPLAELFIIPHRITLHVPEGTKIRMKTDLIHYALLCLERIDRRTFTMV